VSKVKHMNGMNDMFANTRMPSPMMICDPYR